MIDNFILIYTTINIKLITMKKLGEVAKDFNSSVKNLLNWEQ
jgi:hypothetical protein